MCIRDRYKDDATSSSKKVLLRSKFGDAKTDPPAETYSTLSPVLNLWFGRYIALGGTETVISVLPATPTTTELYVVPIPTEFGASNVCLCPKSIFLFSNLVSNSNVKSVGVLLTATPLLCAVAAVLLCDLVTLYLLLTVSTLVSTFVHYQLWLHHPY